MWKTTVVLAFTFVCSAICANSLQSNENDFRSGSNSRIVYLDQNDATEYLEATNYFTEQNSLSISLKTKGEIEDVNLETARKKYRKYVSTNLKEWRESDKKYVDKRFNHLIPYIVKYTPAVLPDTIFVIKSSKNIEFSSPFTKGKAIIIPESEIPSLLTSWLNKNFFEQTLAHELFHIYSSNNLTERENLYSLIGFEKMEKVSIPETLQAMQIVNPDDNISHHYTISLNNPLYKEEQNFMVLILSKYPKYEGYKGLLSRINLLAGYSEIKLARVIKSDKGWNVGLKDGHPELFFKNEVPEYWEKIRLVHNITMTPEETLAEDYAILISTKINAKELKSISSVGKDFLHDFEMMLNSN